MTTSTLDTAIAIRCPKCSAEMARYERAGVLVDQCRECRGIFLDRGELERLIDLEAAVQAQVQAKAQAPAARPTPMPAGFRAEWDDDDDDRAYGDRRYDDRRQDDDRRRWHMPGRPSKKRSLLGELLDF